MSLKKVGVKAINWRFLRLFITIRMIISIIFS